MLEVNVVCSQMGNIVQGKTKQNMVVDNTSEWTPYAPSYMYKTLYIQKLGYIQVVCTKTKAQKINSKVGLYHPPTLPQTLRALLDGLGRQHLGCSLFWP